MSISHSHPHDQAARRQLAQLAQQSGLSVQGGAILRTSSRFCLGVEHGDYNGTELFGVGTDRFLWTSWRANDLGRVRLFSGAFAQEGLVEFVPGCTPAPRAPELVGRWARYALGCDHVLQHAGYRLSRGIDIVVHSDIPGGGMSRSASLCLNLLHVMLTANGHQLKDSMLLCQLAQSVENDYVGSPCGILDQVMIAFAQRGFGTHYDPATAQVRHVPLGASAPDFRLVALDTGTVRPGLEHSTYAIRRRECEQLVAMLAESFGIHRLAEVRDAALHDRIQRWLGPQHAHLGDRLRYLFEAQQHFGRMLDAWHQGDIATVGAMFRVDGFGLRDRYRISGPELESMCEIARTVPGVLGERMLGGGDKGAAGAIAATAAVPALRAAVAHDYPRRHPELAQRYAVHELQIVDGIAALPPG
jgi:galactokinase